MTYTDAHPVRLAGGRLALDLINTADWSRDGAVVHEKVETMADIAIWMTALGVAKAGRPADANEFHVFRDQLRSAMLCQQSGPVASVMARAGMLTLEEEPDRQPLLTLAAASALSILADPRERGRVKMCPGTNCGWLFMDETGNGRRKWCLMETCGNRAKASGHYQRLTKARAEGRR